MFRVGEIDEREGIEIMKAANRTLAGLALIGLFSGSAATVTVASAGGSPHGGSVVTGPPVAEPPTTEPPTTEPPTTEPPTTEPAAAVAPVSESSDVTEPPVLEPPVTEPPVTEAPVTKPPLPPVTEPSAPTTTEPPVRVADATIGDLVFLDENRNGRHDDGERGIAAVGVELRGAGPDGIFDTTDDTMATGITGETGEYLFARLVAGTHRVSVDTTGLTAGLVATDDEDGGGDSISVVELTESASHVTADFGYARPVSVRATNAIGDTVWNDVDRDGIDDGAAVEPRLADVRVRITWLGPDCRDEIGEIVGTYRTTSQGAYLATDLEDGRYVAEIAGGVPDGYEVTADPQGTTTPAIWSRIEVAGGESDLDQDFGFASPVQTPPERTAIANSSAVGDQVYIDSNSNRRRDRNEAGVPGLAITVTSPGPDGLSGTADDVISTTTTGSDGDYLVDGLPSGRTIVAYDPGGLPVAMKPVGDLDAGEPNRTTVDLADGETNRNVDFIVGPDAQIPPMSAPGGISAPGSIKGLVFHDANRDTRQDGNENGAKGVTVVLYDANAVEIAQTTTGGRGFFVFVDLPEGDYTVISDGRTLPTNHSIVTETDGTVDGRTVVSVMSGAETRSGDFGIAEPMSAAPSQRRSIPRTGAASSMLAQLALSALLAGLGLKLIRRRPHDQPA